MSAASWHQRHWPRGRVCLDCGQPLEDGRPGHYCERHGQSGTTALAPCEVTWSIRARFWAVRVLICPFCRREHHHGAGEGRRPDLGYRVAHCADAGSYLLMETAASLARRQERAPSRAVSGAAAKNAEVVS